MSSNAKEATIIRPPQAPRSVVVVNWPLRDGGVGAWGMAIGLVLIAVVAGVISQSRVMGTVCFAALVTATWRLWLPVTFEFRSRGVIYTVLGRSRQIPWTHIARFEVRPRGVLLFPDIDLSPLASLRSVYVQWNEQKAAIMEVIKFYSSAQVSVASTKTYLNEAIEDPEN
ncbi:MAG: hypothetical protein H6822_29330 [Planctomycetaceae bacterium]|nr:hypothetical protein [Planctomycetales bacterium]MCB9926286.1 hypothetical protein [Planctomycetaceae bacterium]